MDLHGHGLCLSTDTCMTAHVPYLTVMAPFSGRQSSVRTSGRQRCCRGLE